MALDPSAAQKALIAFQRFGLGAKPGGPARIGSNPLAALQAEINTPGIALINDSTLPTYAKACAEGESGFERSNAVRQREIDARVSKHLAVEIGFVERLVIFWSNHFSVSVDKKQIVRSTVGQLERDVIRKHVLGNFSDMLLGVMRHPAMLTFLDNNNSLGPNSIIGLKRKLGLNENLAREIMELHTVGAGGGYSEADVRAFANILTGWSYVTASQSDKGLHGGTKQNRGQFIFRPDWHQPGAFSVMGKTYPAMGQKQAEAVLLDLARRPATAEHLALKLLRHFVSDDPTPAMVARIANVFLKTGGNLKAVATALINTPEAWSAPLAKVRTPYELAIAQFRTLQTRYTAGEAWIFSRMLRSQQQMVWECQSVAGFSDDTPAWLNADGMRLRLDTALLASRYYGVRRKAEAPELAKLVYDAALSRATLAQIVAGGNWSKKLAILFASPEFQRR